MQNPNTFAGELAVSSDWKISTASLNLTLKGRYNLPRGQNGIHAYAELKASYGIEKIEQYS